MSTTLAKANDYTKPYYTIEFTAQRLDLEIRINDIPAFEVDNSGFMTLEIPVNEYIINGKNNIKVITYPFFDDDDEQSKEYIDGTTIEVSLYVRESTETKDDRKLVSQALITPQLAYTENAKKEVAILKQESTTKENQLIQVSKDSSILNYPLYGAYDKQVVTTWDTPILKTPFSTWGWETGQVIHDNKEIYNSLLKSYTEIHDAFSNKDLMEIKKISSQRSNELAAAYYLGNQEDGFEYTAIGQYVDHPKAKLYNQLYTEDTKLDILADGKLARIMDGAGNHPVVFVDDETGQIHSAQFLWYKNENDKWVLIR